MRGYGPKNVGIRFTAARLTHFGGLPLLHRYFQALDLRRVLTRSVRFAQRNNRYSIGESFLALLYPMILGIGRIETTRLLQHNGVFQYLTGLPTYPDAQTIRRFLTRFGESGLTAFLKLHDKFRRRWIGRPNIPPSMTLDFDTTVLTVYGKQEGSAIGYNPKKRGRPSYLPFLCFDGATGDCWEATYHPGDKHPGGVFQLIFERAFAKIPKYVREVRVRADAAFYDREIIAFIEAKSAFYAIVAKLTVPLKARVTAARYRRVSGSVFAAEFRYHPQGWPGPRRFVAIRRLVQDEPSYQLTLWKMGKYNYQVMVTNLNLTPLNLWRFYNDRARAELVIRELKDGYAMGKIPTGDWAANEAYFQLVVFAYNLLGWFKRTCVPEEWKRLTMQTIRNRLLLIPAELTRPGGRPVLKMPLGYPYKREYMKTLRAVGRL